MEGQRFELLGAGRWGWLRLAVCGTGAFVHKRDTRGIKVERFSEMGAETGFTLFFEPLGYDCVRKVREKVDDQWIAIAQGA